MRPERTVQPSIFDRFAAHEIGREPKAMSAWLDEHRELLGLVAADLRRHASPPGNQVPVAGTHGSDEAANARVADGPDHVC
jgi:hypothetical protein